MRPIAGVLKLHAAMTLPSRASLLTTLLVGLGLLCCIYLAALKLINAPCPLEGCGNIINSRYGTIHGIPLPLLAIPLWIVLALPVTRPWQVRLQFASVLLLALGGLVLMGIQYIVLRGFCAFCTLHAFTALAAAVALPVRGRAHAWLPALMLALALPLVLAVKDSTEARFRSSEAPVASAPLGPNTPGSGVAPAPPTLSLPANIDQAAFRWLGEIDAKRSPLLVVSFQCAHCLDLLEQTLRRPQFGSFKGPKIFVYAQPHDSADSIAVLAAMLSVAGTPREQFAAVFSQLDSLRDPLLNHDSKELRRQLGILFPKYTEKLADAGRQFNVQVVALKFVPGKGSPFLLLPDGSSTYGVATSDLLFP
jgi:uncharacterized membrane protein